MKHLFFAMILMFSATIFAADTSVIYTHRMDYCSSWSYVRTDNGSGYLCSFRGSSVTVPDANSLLTVINELEDRILALEGKLKQLEAR